MLVFLAHFTRVQIPCAHVAFEFPANQFLTVFLDPRVFFLTTTRDVDCVPVRRGVNIVRAGAMAVAGVAAVQLTRAFASWRKENITFDFPIEEQLFIGWGGGNPRRVKRPT